jgi:tetratricopeptide (TPR) repeat protein
MSAWLNRSLWFALTGLGVVCPASGAEVPSKQLSAAVSAELGKLRTLTDTHDYAAARGLIDRRLETVVAPSFDQALLLLVKGQIFIAEGHYELALAALQRSLELSERYAFLETRTQLNTLYLVSQLNAQLAADSTLLTLRKRYLEDALECARRWLALSPAANAEVQLHVASLYYHLALLDAAKPDVAQLQRARRAAEECLLLERTPREASYVMLLAILQQLEQGEAVTDLLELLVKRDPNNGVYWQQLASGYLTQANATSDPALTARFQLRTLLTLERAQTHGHLMTEADDACLKALHLALGSPPSINSRLP